MNTNIREIQIDKNLSDVKDLWDRVFKPTWPISDESLVKGLGIHATHKQISLAAFIDGKLMGYILIKYKDEKAQLALLMVDPNYKRKGLGTSLFEESVTKLNKLNIKELELMTGIGAYFWPGIPKEFEEALEFFKKMGFVFKESCVDMISKLGKVKFPLKVKDKFRNLGLNVRLAKKDDKKKLLQFEKKEFPDWYKYYKDKFEKDEYEKILIVEDDADILGATLLLHNEDIFWAQALENSASGLGALGVKQSARGQGIGLYLAAYGSKLLKDRGFKYSFLGWTYLVDWYGKLGYTIWKTYQRGTYFIR